MSKKVKEKKVTLMDKIKNILNSPKIILTILSIICVLLLIYSFSLKSTLNKNGEIFVGTIEEDEIYISNIHYLTNNKMNYFYAAPAYIKEEAKIYSYNIGYYVKDNKGTLIPLAKRDGKIEDGLNLNDVVNDLSSWNFAELEQQDVFFTKENKKYLKNLYFIINASSDKDKDEYDIKYEYKVKFISLTE